MTPGEYAEFREALVARHRNSMTSAISILGDGILLAALPVGLARRSVRAWLGLAIAGLGVAFFAHLFQPGTLKDEAAAVMRHPLRAAQAEAERVVGLLLKDPS